jgi:cation diffusion facilitator CzcD-associated flavoprotein CzcO
VLLRNNSNYLAKNPAVIVQLCAIAFFDKKHLPESWVITDFTEIPEFVGLGTAYMSLQWDGGPTYSIHGHSIRRLPDLHLSDLWVLPGWGSPELKIVILADGYRKEVRLPVDFVVDGTSQVREQDWEEISDWV